MNIRAWVAEAVGTFILLTFGLLGVATYVLATGGNGGAQAALLIIPFSFGLGLMAAIAVAGPASGGHFNPAVTLAALFDGRLDWKNAIGYAVAQVIGALGGAIAVMLLTTKDFVGAAVNQPGPTSGDPFTNELHSFSGEVILTAVFVAVILTVTRKAPDQAILVIPLTLVAIHYVGIFISGASVNPTRSLAPAMIAGNYASLWVYLTGPFVGSILGWGVYRFLTPPDDDLEAVAEGELDEEELEEDDD